MKNRLPLIGLTLAMLVALDVVVALGLVVAGRLGGPFTSIVSYFDYGRSVPGKHQQWTENANAGGNLYSVAWRDDVLALSRDAFAADATDAPIIRSYGMSFLNDMTRAAEALRPGVVVDRHAGPAASPNYVFSLFEDDAMARRPEDVALLGILSSSVGGMTSFSNSSWLFEQPAPFTYPVYRLEGGTLTRTEPVVLTEEMHRELPTNRDLARAWTAQRRALDGFYHPVTHGWTWADHSPFSRLARRYAATYFLTETEQTLLGTGGRRQAQFDFRAVLAAMVDQFAAQCRQEGVIPVVVLIQTRGDTPDLRAALAEHLTAAGIPYMATADHYDIRDPAGFKEDGHYRPEPNARFASVLMAVIDAAAAQNP